MIRVVLLVAGAGLLVGGWHASRRELKRMKSNQEALTQQVHHYKTRLGEEVASVAALRLKCSEFEQLRAADAEQIRRLKIRLKRVEAAGHTATLTRASVAVPLRDTCYLYDTVRLFSWRDPWVEIEGELRRDSVWCRLRSVDTLFQVVHRVPRRFLFIRWGTKGLRQEIRSSNPHTQVVYSEYIRLEK